MNGYWYFGWHWIWFVGLLLLLVAPLLSHFRLTYAAIWSALLIGMILSLWVRNASGHEELLFGFPRFTPSVGVGRAISLFSGTDTVGIAYTATKTTKGLVAEDWKEGLWVSWSRTVGFPERYPAWRD